MGAGEAEAGVPGTRYAAKLIDSSRLLSSVFIFASISVCISNRKLRVRARGAHGARGAHACAQALLEHMVEFAHELLRLVGQWPLDF